MQIAVVGGGSWGTALASLMSHKGLAVQLLVRQEEQANKINTEHRNELYLPNIDLAKQLLATTNPGTALTIQVFLPPLG